MWVYIQTIVRILVCVLIGQGEGMDMYAEQHSAAGLHVISCFGPAMN